MTISEETAHVLEYLDNASGQGLRKRNDIGVLLELAADADAHEEINALAFQGSFLYNVYQTLRRATAGAEGYAVLEREFASAVESLREHIAKLLVTAEDEQVSRFNEQYY